MIKNKKDIAKIKKDGNKCIMTKSEKSVEKNRNESTKMIENAKKRRKDELGRKKNDKRPYMLKKDK